MKKNKIISNWLKEKGNPEIARLVSLNLAISNKVHKILEERKLSDTDFAKMLGKTPSEVSKWLSGTHNLTQKSIIKMEIALGEPLIHVEQVEKYVYFHIERTTREKVEEYTEGNYNTTMPAYAS
ncbi:helix-turn-helix transcriptional regulator [uncultured Maribacter sp.]|uniref:helix-turn-helix domain-containing protein n=1 Tax=uncultured Maribacter sp. TaxID=431308 RepID=UPI0030EBC6EA|tara:strand:- start:39662 stop:40033 length:372 start_codon:yes stop_codon:yes gene_type:complete